MLLSPIMLLNPTFIPGNCNASGVRANTTQRAMDTGEAYQMLLDPPLSHPSVVLHTGGRIGQHEDVPNTCSRRHYACFQTHILR